MGSLWLRPNEKPEVVPVSRWEKYPHFMDSFEMYGVKLPALVKVVWEPLEQYLCEFSDDLDQSPGHITWVEQELKQKADIPPILLLDGEVFDGRHRAWAAWNIGLRQAPVLDISKYWKKKR